LGRWREAADHYRSAVVEFDRVGVHHREAEGLLRLGEALIELGETEEARSCLRKALALGDAADSNDLKTVQKLLDSLPAE
ncbi:tetratricopeptide repeat protein, partial [Streptomyces sp. NPDC058107]|uniref:tetratricopeptide repeat protein n=1 Tax=Streptomyces sp. NPDC058107 TaxID=3346343 RepID=UPI0036E35E64